jgi:nitric oxide reductase subunit B
VLIPAEQIGDGQNVWQAMGGMQVGSIWGHGSYVAPDWTADYLHREALFVLNEWSGGQFGKDGATMQPEQRAMLVQRLQTLLRTNTYDEATGRLTLDPIRGRAFETISSITPTYLRTAAKDYAIQQDAQSDPAKLTCVKLVLLSGRRGHRLQTARTITSRTPVISRQSRWSAISPTSSSIVWTGVSVILLIASIGRHGLVLRRVA